MKKQPILLAAVASLAGLLSASCSSSNGDDHHAVPPATGGGGAASGGAGGTGNGGSGGNTTSPRTSGLSCIEILDCVAKCPEASGDACADACLASGSEEGKTATTNLALCFQQHGCQDETCLKTNCDSELTACVSQGASTTSAGKPVEQPPQQGKVPPELVGKWHHFEAPTAHIHDFTFNADGTATEYVTTAYSVVGCVTTGLGDYTGTVVFTDTTMTFYATAGIVLWDSCGTKTEKMIDPKSSDYKWWFDQQGNLVLENITTPGCVEKPGTCARTYTKQ